jgi:hypothetical protein
MCNLLSTILIRLSVRLSVCASVITGRSLSLTTRRIDYVTGKRKVTVDAEKNDGKKMRRP